MEFEAGRQERVTELHMRRVTNLETNTHVDSGLTERDFQMPTFNLTSTMPCVHSKGSVGYTTS